MTGCGIQAEALYKSYGGAGGVAALAGVNCVIETGQRVAVIGKSGSGKSTLLNLFAGLDRPTSGQLTIAGRELHSLSSKEMARYRLDTVGVVFQAFQLIPQRTALQNVEVPLILAGKDRQTRLQQATQWLDKVGLSHRIHHHPYELSGGEQQRVAIARALVNQPKVVLADEPTGNLDTTTASDIVQLLTELCNQTQATFLLVTHDVDIADRLCKRKLIMRDGRLTEADDDSHA
ncbi:MAG: ABC transporter ATP-binding protein [Planctomycetales bacterium]|nr:ABC transporter ATP-binding protein [Planctomycetales bacterium]